MFFYVGNPKSLKELRKARPEQPSNIRTSVPVGVVDDEPFPFTDILRDHDFQIKELGDISDIKAVSPYHVVLCDIKGVGKAFSSKHEGGHVIEEIKRYYPFKIVIAYTAHRFSPSFNKFFQMCDFSLNKDADSDDWVAILDEATKEAVDPVEQWIKVRNTLMNMEIPALDIVLLEDQYVKRILGERGDFPGKNLSNHLNESVQQLIVRFTSTVLASLITP